MLQRSFIIGAFLLAGTGNAAAANLQCESEPFERGIASIYALSLQGNLTKSEEPFDHAQFTAAHRTLPMGQMVEITDNATGATALVRINDRGPHVRGRIIDVTRAVRTHLGWNPRRGLHRVTLRLCR